MADGPVTVAPISVEREFAAGWDALVDSNELDLAYDCMVEMWNYGQVARVQLDETFGRIHPAAQTRLERMWQETRKGEEVPPVGTHTGPPILGDQDPRLGFERDEIERASAFYTTSHRLRMFRELAGSARPSLSSRNDAALEAPFTSRPWDLRRQKCSRKLDLVKFSVRQGWFLDYVVGGVDYPDC